MQNFDVNRDGELDWDEFCEAIKVLLQTRHYEEEQPLLAKGRIDYDSMKDMSSINRSD